MSKPQEQIIRCLDQAARKLCISSWLRAIIIVILSSAFSYNALYYYELHAKLASGISTQAWIYFTVFAGVLCFALAFREDRILDCHRVVLVNKVKSSGLIERMALGIDHIAVIHDHTPWPWRILLGPKPSTMEHSIRLLLANLDWYLAEPRRYVNTIWIWAVIIVALLVPYILGVFLGGQVVQARPGETTYIVDVMTYGMVVMCLAIWVTHYHNCRRKITAQVLLVEFRQRVDGG